MERIARMVCDGRNELLVTTRAFYGCGWEKRVPFSERFEYTRCPKCGGQVVTFSVDEVG